MAELQEMLNRFYVPDKKKGPNNNGDIHPTDIIAFSFNLGTLTPEHEKTVLKIKLSHLLYRLNNYSVPKSWGWNA